MPDIPPSCQQTIAYQHGGTHKMQAILRDRNNNPCVTDFLGHLKKNLY